jgi:hypothetical protein
MSASFWIAIGIVVVFALLLVACQTSTVITALEAVVDAAEVAVPVIGAATGLPASTMTAIEDYLQAVSQATSQAATILAGTATSAEKTAEIIAAFAKVAAGLALPAGTTAEVVAVVKAVAQAVVNFLAEFPPAAASEPSFKVTASDRTKLMNLKARSETLVTTVRGMKR